jgi:5'-nucleotidase
VLPEGVDSAPASAPVAESVPEAAKARAGASRKPGGPTYVVRQDESLWKIAARTLGDGARWKEIADANPDINPDRISEGQTLVLPVGATPTLAKRSDRLAQATPAAVRGRVR